MTAHDLKSDMLAYCLYKLHYQAAVTECGNGSFGIADVFGILGSGFTAEYEVKVAKGDLAGEIKSIRAICEERDLFADPNKKVNVAKYPKHNAYLKNGGYMAEHYSVLSMRPNYFSFVVPPELAEYAYAGLEGTPYGLYVVSASENTCKRRPRRLHDDRADDRLRGQILHKACTELQSTRSDLAKGRKCKEWNCRAELSLRCPSCDEKEQDRRKKEREYRKQNEEAWAKLQT